MENLVYCGPSNTCRGVESRQVPMDATNHTASGIALAECPSFQVITFQAKTEMDDSTH